jgi:dUTP pyrophosphatase
VNLSQEPFTIEHGDRVAQLVIAKHEHADWTITDELSETDRGAGGFGSTGIQ